MVAIFYCAQRKEFSRAEHDKHVFRHSTHPLRGSRHPFTFRVPLTPSPGRGGSHIDQDISSGVGVCVTRGLNNVPNNVPPHAYVQGYLGRLERDTSEGNRTVITTRSHTVRQGPTGVLRNF